MRQGAQHEGSPTDKSVNESGSSPDSQQSVKAEEGKEEGRKKQASSLSFKQKKP